MGVCACVCACSWVCGWTFEGVFHVFVCSFASNHLMFGCWWVGWMECGGMCYHLLLVVMTCDDF